MATVTKGDRLAAQTISDDECDRGGCESLGHHASGSCDLTDKIAQALADAREAGRVVGWREARETAARIAGPGIAAFIRALPDAPPAAKEA